MMLMLRRGVVLALLLTVFVVAEDEECGDSSTWEKKLEPAKNCSWVANKKSRCVARDAVGGFAYESCKAACGGCEEAGCVDDPEWRYNDLEYADCFWASRYLKRCVYKLDDDSYVYERCGASCGACGRKQHCETNETATYSPTPLSFTRREAEVRLFDGDAPGGYSKLTIGKEGFDVAERLNALGVHAFVLAYRVPERGYIDTFGWAPLVDAQRALSIVRADTPWDLRPSAVGVVGFSAGGHLAARLATETTRLDDNDDAQLPDFAALVYPWKLVDVMGDPWSKDLADDFNLPQDAPPMFFDLAHAADDGTAPQTNSLVFFNHLISEEKGEKHHLEVHARGGHGFGVCTVNDDPAEYVKQLETEICAWPDNLAAWLRRTLKVLD